MTTLRARELALILLSIIVAAFVIAYVQNAYQAAVSDPLCGTDQVATTRTCEATP